MIWNYCGSISSFLLNSAQTSNILGLFSQKVYKIRYENLCFFLIYFQLSKLSQVSELLREIWYPGSVPDLQTICSLFWVTPPSNSYWFFLFSETKMTLVSIHQNDASPPWEACRQKRNETNVTVRPSRYRQS